MSGYNHIRSEERDQIAQLKIEGLSNKAIVDAIGRDPSTIIDLDRSTLADWVEKSADLLEPLAAAIQRHVLSGRAIFADDASVNMLSPSAGKTKTAKLIDFD